MIPQGGHYRGVLTGVIPPIAGSNVGGTGPSEVEVLRLQSEPAQVATIHPSPGLVFI